MKKTVEVTLKFEPPSTGIDYTEKLISFHREIADALEKEVKCGFNVVRATCTDRIFEFVLSGGDSVRIKDGIEDPLKLNKLLNCSIQELELSVRSYNTLVHKLRLETIGDLVRKTDKELLKIQGFGLVSLTEVKNLLLDISLHYGVRLHLGMELPKSE